MRHLASPEGTADFQAWAVSPGRTLLEALQEFPSARPPLGASISASLFGNREHSMSPDGNREASMWSQDGIGAKDLIRAYEVCKCNDPCCWRRHECPSVVNLPPI